MPSQDYSQWAVLNSRDEPICDYIGVMSVAIQKQASVLTEPIENGQLAAYNKVQAPDGAVISIAIDGDPATQTAALADLEALKQGTGKGYLCKIVSPYFVLDNLALETISQSRSASQNATTLICELSFIAIRSVTTGSQAVLWQPKNATSADPVDSGRVQPENSGRASTAWRLVNG